MASLGSFFAVDCGNIPSANVYISHRGDNETILITSRPKFIAVVNLTGRRLDKDWSLKRGLSLTSAVCYDQQNNKYVAAVDHKVIHSWDDDSVSIEKSPKQQIPKAVHKILSTPLACIALYEDGAYASVQEPRALLGKSLVPGDQEIVWSDAVCDDVLTALVFITREKDTDCSHVKANVYVFGTSIDNAQFYEHRLELKGESWLCSCIQVRDDDVYLMTLWSKGSFTAKPIKDTTSSAEQLQPIGELDAKVADLACVDESHVAVVGTKNQDGVGACIWDNKFGVKKACVKLPDSSISKARIHCSGNKLLLATDKGVYVSTYAVQESTLSSVLGRFRATAEVSGDMRPQRPLCESAQQLLVAQSGPAFKKAFSRFLQQLQSSGEDKLLVCSYISRLIAKWSHSSQENKNFQLPVEEVKGLIVNELVGGSDLKLLLPMLIKAKQAALVHLAIVHASDVPESSLPSVLTFFIGCEENRLTEAAAELSVKADEMEDCPIHKNKAIFLNAILKLPLNDIFLQAHLRNLRFSDAMSLLNYLHYLLNITSVTAETLPSVAQVSDWLSCVLDGHFTQLILSQDARAFLVELHQTVEKRVEFNIEEMNILEALLTQLKERCELPQVKNIGHYCIETLHIL